MHGVGEPSAMFIRFVVGSDDENAAWLTGIITEARILKDAGRLYRHESEWLEETYGWLNENLTCPPFSAKLRSGEWSREAVCWFHPGARRSVVRRLWDIAAILEEHAVPVRLVKSDKPGKIVYEDSDQVVAETPYWA